jgi:hypothetical protein
MQKGLADYRKCDLPRFPGLIYALGPGVVWMALAQGSSELIWWPYIVAKYGLAFLFLLLPACLLQYPVNYEIGRYTLLTGESIFQSFIRMNRFFALFLFILMALSFLWFGAYASAGGTALAALTNFPSGWSVRGQTLFWAYLSIAVCFIAIFFSGVVYRLIEKLMWGVAVLTVIGLIWACLEPDVRFQIPSFLKGLFIPQWPKDHPWDPKDITKLLTAITFAGLGGFWTLFYSYWLREKGAGMASYMGHISGWMSHRKERIPDAGFVFGDNSENKKKWQLWRKYLGIDSSIGIFGNIFTTLMTCLLAYALLFPKGLVPDEYQIAVVQSQFFEVGWGAMGRVLFLLVAAAFLADTWLATVDAVSRIYTDFVYNFFPSAKRWPVRNWYFIFIIILTLITSVTMPLAQPGPLILISAVIGFIGTVLFTGALVYQNRWVIPKIVPQFAQPSRLSFVAISISWTAYLALAIAYFYAKFFL